MIHALIIEDESLLAARLARLLGKVAPGIEILERMTKFKKWLNR